MNPSRIILGLSFLLLMPLEAQAAVGLQPGFENIHIEPEPEPEPEAPEKLTEEEVIDQAQWDERRLRNTGFWANTMNYRKHENAFRDGHTKRREARRQKRLQCRVDVRKANRDSILRETLHCFRATLSQDLEMLRKQKQYIDGLPGTREEYRDGALFHIGKLSDAISTIIAAIDAGVYSTKEGLQDAKQNLGEVFRSQKRLAVTRLRVDRATAWLNHLMLRLHDVHTNLQPPEEVTAKIGEAISCLESQEAVLEGLLPMEDNDALIEAFRQAQSDTKFCIDLAYEAHSLNTELEQAEAENE